jgi:hypothetical protein
MTRDFELGKWITGKYKTRAAFAKKLGVDPTRLSRWMNLSDGISDDYQQKIRDLKYDGPWPQEEAKATPAQAPGPYVTEAAFEVWRQYWREGEERILNRLKTLEDQVQKLRQQAESK